MSQGTSNPTSNPLAQTNITPLYIFGFGCMLAASNAWSDAVKSSIDTFYPERENARAKLAFAIIITIVVILVFWAAIKINDQITSVRVPVQ